MLSVEIVTFALPVFETEIVFAEELPIFMLPKLTLLELTVSVPTAGGVVVVELEEVLVVEEVVVELVLDVLLVVGGGTTGRTLLVPEDVEAEDVEEPVERPPKNKPLMTEFG
jgi:hypothetical protein